MKTRTRIVGLTMSLGLLLLLSATPVALAENGASIFESELQNIRYNYDYRGSQTDDVIGDPSGEDDLTLADLAQADFRPPEYKSPGRAFVYSLAVPGLGQLYSGSKIKPLLFLAVEVFGISQALKYHNSGDDMTADFEQFNRDHWNHPDSIYSVGGTDYQAYQAYLVSAYGSLRPDLDSLLTPEDRRGFTHVLPDTRTQQYYEMTGKYNQFAWGWDDARLNETGDNLSDLIQSGGVQRAITDETTPHSDNRIIYEGMRDDANREFDKGRKMVFVVMGNHLVSAFEAFFATKRHNNQMKYDQTFSNVYVKPSFRSYNQWKDTPYMTLSYKF